MLFQPCPPSELPACKILGEGCIYIGSTCYDVILFYSPAGFVFIIIPVILRDSTKTGFIVWRSSVMHCLYIGLQLHPRGKGNR